MKSFSLNRVTQDYAARVLESMNRNKGYIIFFNKANYKEAYQRIFMAAMREEKTEYENLDPYIKVLARNVMKIHSRDIPYAPYNEEGEVALVFTPLVDTPDMDKFQDKDLVLEALQEIYLMYPEDFTKLASLIPSSNPADVRGVIKNPKLYERIHNLVIEFEAPLVFYSIIQFITNLNKEKLDAINASAPKSKIFTLYRYDQDVVNTTVTDKKWILDDKGIPCGIVPSTLRMEGDFNPEFHKFRMAIKTVCPIWAIDISDYLNDIETRIYVEQGVDNENILWCGSKYRLTSPAGTPFLGLSKDSFMEYVRQELILSIMLISFVTVVAVGPETVYIKLTKSYNISDLSVHLPNGKNIRLPLSMQKVIPYTG